MSLLLQVLLLCLSVFRFCCSVSLSSGSVAVSFRLHVVSVSLRLQVLLLSLLLQVLSLCLSVFRLCCYVSPSSGSVAVSPSSGFVVMSVFRFCRCVSPVHITSLFYAQSCTSALLLQKDLLPKAGDYTTTQLHNYTTTRLNAPKWRIPRLHIRQKLTSPSFLCPSMRFRMNVCKGSWNKLANYRRDEVRKIDPWFFVETQREANCIE